MQDLKNKIEAVLFITARAMAIEEIAQFCNIGSIGTIKEAMAAIQKDYETRLGSLEIVEDDGKYRLNIKKQYNHLSTKLLSTAELDAPTQATLALIAYKQPILQSEIINMRGNTAYDHIHALKAMEFIVSEKNGRTRSLKLAPKFFDYFDVVQETLQQKFSETLEKQEKLIDNSKVIKESEPKAVNEENLNKELEINITPKENKDNEVEVKEKKKKKSETKQQAQVVTSDVNLEIQKTPQEVILNLNADDFGSKC